jgi:hypothetical protein
MSFYGFSDIQKLLTTPVVTFWMLHKNIDRLMAERDMRTADVAIRSQSAEGVRDLFEDLKKQMGTVVDFDRVLQSQEAVIDREGLKALKGLEGAFG